MEKLKGHNILLLDAAGAAVSLVYLLFLYTYDEFFGMPKNVIILFMCIATVYFIYSATIYFIRPENWKLYLKIIAALNISYCLYTIYQMLQHSDTLTKYGYVYFLAEILVIIVLSAYELKNANKTSDE